MSEGRLIQVFRSARRADTYLFVDLKEGLARVPAPLLEHFGRPEAAMRLHLTAQRRLARADAATVLNAIREQGFYLQLPPPEGAGDDG